MSEALYMALLSTKPVKPVAEEADHPAVGAFIIADNTQNLAGQVSMEAKCIGLHVPSSQSQM